MYGASHLNSSFTTSSTFTQASGIVREGGKEDNGETLWQEDLQRICDIRIRRCCQTVSVFSPLISNDFLYFLFFFLIHCFLVGPWIPVQRSSSFLWGFLFPVKPVTAWLKHQPCAPHWKRDGISRHFFTVMPFAWKSVESWSFIFFKTTQFLKGFLLFCDNVV